MTSNSPSGFQWDEDKNKINIQKHGIDFRDAVRVFEKPTLDKVDNRHEYNETRTNSIGDLDGQFIVNVTHTDRNGETRLISARLAKEAERTAYLEFIHELEAQKIERQKEPQRNIAAELIERGRQWAARQPEQTSDQDHDRDADVERKRRRMPWDPPP